MASRALLPPACPPPFPDPVFRKARRCGGMVATPSFQDANSTEAPALKRQESVSGDILVIQVDKDVSGGSERAYLMQRKLRETPFGSVRVGYVVEKMKDSGIYHVKPTSKGSGEYDMLEIAMENKARIMSEPSVAYHHSAELSALQMIAALLPSESLPMHLQRVELVAADEQFIYTICPYHKDGSLYDYCSALGRLSEDDARYFFRQVLSVRNIDESGRLRGLHTERAH